MDDDRDLCRTGPIGVRVLERMCSELVRGNAVAIAVAARITVAGVIEVTKRMRVVENRQTRV